MELADLKAAFEESKNIVITSHRSPDGDAIGSSLALSNVLKQHGHQVDVIVPDSFPNFLKWMFGAPEIVIYEYSKIRSKERIEKADFIFSLDYNNLSRVAELGDLIETSSAKKLMIDHHIGPDESYDFIMSDTSASSTAQMVFDFIEKMELKKYVDVNVAEALYAGIMTDTGSFRFSSTSARTHEVVAELMKIGLKPEKVHQNIFDSNSYSKLKLVGFALSERFEFDPEKGISIIHISQLDKQNFNYQKGDTEGLVNYGLSVSGSKMAVFVSEDEGYTKFSFRSKGDIDVNVIARAHFNGGGHKNAAGGRLDLSIEEAYRHLKKVLDELY